MNIDTAAIRRLRAHLIAQGGAVASFSSEPLPHEDAIRQRVEPFAETMFLVMMADDEAAAIERSTLRAALHLLTDGQLSSGGMTAMLDAFEARVRSQGIEARFAHLGAHLGGSRDDRETAFTLGAVVALADESVGRQESHALEWLKEYYGVSERRIEALLGLIE